MAPPLLFLLVVALIAIVGAGLFFTGILGALTTARDSRNIDAGPEAEPEQEEGRTHDERNQRWVT